MVSCELLERMKPDPRLQIYRTKVSTIPSDLTPWYRSRRRCNCSATTQKVQSPCSHDAKRSGGRTMTNHARLLRRSLAGIALAAAVSAAASATAQSVTPGETARSVRRMLERLPYYGVFDYLVFRVDGGTVYLAGYGFEERLKADAEMAARQASGVVEVADKIEVLPAALNDD